MGGALEKKQSMERKQAMKTMQAQLMAMEAMPFERLCIHFVCTFVFVCDAQ